MDPSIKNLLDEVSTGLAELASSHVEGQSNTAEISATLLDLLEWMKARKDESVVNVTVQPAEVKVLSAEWFDKKITYEWDGDKMVGATITRIKPEGASS